MSEIVVAEPINDDQNRASTSSSRRAYTTNDTRPYTRSLTSGRQHIPEPFDSEKLPVTLVSEIQRFLRVANLTEIDEPRVAYLCRFHTFEVAHNLDRNSSGRGVRQFKTSLLQRLEQDCELTIRKRREKCDSRELRRVYRQYKDYIIKHGGEYTLENREKLIKARAIASVLFEVLNTVTSAAGSQALAEAEHSRSEFYVPYNILPLDQGGVHQVIMQLPEVEGARTSDIFEWEDPPMCRQSKVVIPLLLRNLDELEHEKRCLERMCRNSQSLNVGKLEGENTNLMAMNTKLDEENKYLMAMNRRLQEDNRNLVAINRRMQEDNENLITMNKDLLTMNRKLEEEKKELRSINMELR